jgi:hypothetical protein
MVSAERILQALLFLGGRGVNTVQDADFLVDAAIAQPGSELEAKVRDFLSTCL